MDVFQRDDEKNWNKIWGADDLMSILVDFFTDNRVYDDVWFGFNKLLFQVVEFYVHHEKKAILLEQKPRSLGIEQAQIALNNCWLLSFIHM